MFYFVQNNFTTDGGVLEENPSTNCTFKMIVYDSNKGKKSIKNRCLGLYATI